jgi:hypothetical protein
MSFRGEGARPAPETRNAPEPVGPGRLVRLCSASEDGDRIPVAVAKAEAGEHGRESATAAGHVARTAPEPGGAGWTAPEKCPPIGLQ